MIKIIRTITLESIKHWFKSDVSIYAAAGAYFSIFALVPLVIAVLIVSNALLDSNILKNYLTEAGLSFSPDITQLIVTSIENFNYNSVYGSLPFFGFLFFLWVVIYTFTMLINGIHHITDVESGGIRGWLVSSARSIVFFLILIFFLVILVVFEIITSEVLGYRELYGFLNQIFNIAFTVLFLTIAYWILSIKPLPARDRFFGAIAATILFSFLQYIIAWWIQSTPAVDYFGATGIIVGLLLLLYLSFSIFYFGITVAYMSFRER